LGSEFWELCQLNPDLQLEKNSDGSVVIKTPAGSESSRINSNFTTLLGMWRLQSRSGVAFDSSFGFKLPDGSIKSPNASWIRQDRWDAVPADAKKRFAPIVPDFVVEIRGRDSFAPGCGSQVAGEDAGVSVGGSIACVVARSRDAKCRDLSARERG
jgi:Uma2 family endonuclease